MKNKKTDSGQTKPIHLKKDEDTLRDHIQTIVESDEQKGALVPDIQPIITPDVEPQSATDSPPNFDNQTDTDTQPTSDAQTESTSKPESSEAKSSK